MFSKSQFGYKDKKSIDDWMFALEREADVSISECIVYLDLQNAFDSAPNIICCYSQYALLAIF